MRPNRVAAMIDDGETVVNAWLSSNSSYLAEVLSHAGFDAVTVDLQHGMMGIDGAIALLQGISVGPATPMARCSHLDQAEIAKLLDAGAYGVICPSIDTVEQCIAFVAACRYPPRGRRSFGPARGLLYGGPDYAGEADTTVQAWAMIESAAALDALEEIVAVAGLDGVYVGPNDLALSLGVTAGTDPLAPEVQEALATVVSVAHRAGVAAGAYCATAEQAATLTRIGYDLVTPGNDAVLIRESATRRIRTVRGFGAADAGVVDGAQEHHGGY